MKTKLEKLISEYQRKVSNSEENIKLATEAIRDFRAGKSSIHFFNEEEAFTTRKIADSSKQNFVQIIKDIENLL